MKLKAGPRRRVQATYLKDRLHFGTDASPEAGAAPINTNFPVVSKPQTLELNSSIQ